MFTDGRNINKGVVFAFVTALISGFSIFLNKYAVSAVTPPILFTAAKNSVVVVMLLLLIINAKKIKSIWEVSRKNLLLLGSIGLIGGAVPFYLFFTGLASVSAVNAAILQKTLILWVALFSFIVLKEMITKGQATAIALLFFGNLLVGGFKGFMFSKGEFMILASSVFWAVEYLLAKKVLNNKVEPDIVALFRMGVGSVVLIIATSFSVTKTTFSLDPTSISWVLITSLFLLGYVLSWYRALKYASAITVCSVLASSTIITNLLSATFVTKSLSLDTAAQSLILIIGLIVFYRSAKNVTSDKFTGSELITSNVL
jgi:drug/metabolite transporter (DMT)-like permease